MQKDDIEDEENHIIFLDQQFTSAKADCTGAPKNSFA